MNTPQLAAQRFWAQPERAALLRALAALEPGQRLRVADALAPRDAAPAQGKAEGETRSAPPPLVHYSSTAIRAKLVDTETRETELSFSSEEPYQRWWGIEVLGHKAGECDMAWIASGRAPLLKDHDPSQQIGVIERAWREASTRRNRAVCRFGRTALADQEMQEAADGIRINVSVGYEIRELELVKKDGDTSTFRVTDWLPLECSLVSIPADMTVGVGRSVVDHAAASAVSTEAPALPAQPLSAQPRKERTMSDPTTQALTGDAAFRANVAIIGRLATEYAPYLKAGDEAKAIADGADPQKFNELLLQRVKSGATDTTTLAGLGATPKEAKRYSFLRAVQGQLQGAGVHADAGFEREVSTTLARNLGREPEGIFVPVDVMFAGLKGARESRDFSVGTAGEAGNLVQTTVSAEMWTDVLRNAMRLVEAGVTVLPGLRQNLAVPRKTVAGTLAALTEVAAASETQPTTALPTLTPKRISAYVDPSKQAIIQGEIGIEQMLRQDLIDGAAVLIENQGINGSGSSPNARGIRNVSGIGSVVGGTNGLALAWAHITGLEAACANANASATERAGYLVNTKVVNTAKNTQKAANLQFLWDAGDRPLNGYRALVTNNVPSNLTKGSSSGVCSSLVFSSDWSMFVMGLFGGLDITVDPYTLATTGQVRITLNQFFDFLCRQPGAFAAMDDALTP